MSELLRRAGRLLVAQWAASLAIVVVCATGVAWASAARDSVVSASIRNGEVRTVDLAPSAVGADALAPAAVGPAAVRDETVTRAELAPAAGLSGTDVAPDSVTSRDIGALLGTADFQDTCLGFKCYQGVDGSAIDETTLLGARSSLQGGRARDVQAAGCDPESAVFVRCSGVQVTLPAPGRVLVLGRAAPHVEWGDAERFKGSCQLELGNVEIPGSRVEFWSQTFEGTYEFGFNVADETLLAAVTDVLPAGNHVAWIACNQDVSTGAIEFYGTDVVTVLLSDL